MHAWRCACFALALLSDASPVEAGCAVPEPALWAPASDGKAPLDARITVSLGGFAGLLRDLEVRRVERQAAEPTKAEARGGGPVVRFRRIELPGPVGHRLIQLVPDSPLQADTTYELVARRPESWHPNQWVFGAFTTGTEPDAAPPALRVLAVRYLERQDAGLPARRWIELDIAPPNDGSREGDAPLFAVWLPDARGVLALGRAPSVYLPRQGDTLRISSPEPCGGLHVPLPAKLGRADIALAALDAAGHQSPLVRAAVDFAHPARRGPE